MTASRFAPAPEPAGPVTPDLNTLCEGVRQLVAAAPTLPSRITLQAGENVVEIEWPCAAAPAVARPTDDRSGASASLPDGLVEVDAPVVGTFHHRPRPGEPPFVVVGDQVAVGQQLGIVEAMKLMNAVESTVDGRVVEIVVPDGTGVEFGQPLVRIDVTDLR